MMKRFTLAVAVLAVSFGAALAQEPAEMQPATETAQLLFNTLLSLAAGAAAMLLLGGLCAREAGLVRAKNAGATGVKALALIAVCSLASWLVGFNLATTVEPGGFLGDFARWGGAGKDPTPPDEAARFVHLALAGATGMAIVSGATAERLRFWPFLLFAAAYAGLIFPIAASWKWGEGYLETNWKFVDFAGATLIHACGGWAALAGAVMAGPRLARYDGGEPREQQPHNPGLAAFGGILAWLGLFALVLTAQTSYATADDAATAARIALNALLAGAAGVFAAIVLTEIIYKRAELSILINGAVGGLAALSAGPAEPALWQAAIIGAFSGVIVTVTGPLLDRFRIDDAAGVIPAHLLCGVWGTLIVPWTNENATYLGQLAGVTIVGAFSLSMSILLWTLLRYTLGVRVGAERELAGLDFRSETRAKPG
jgi:Amt family ammonium transporter